MTYNKIATACALSFLFASPSVSSSETSVDDTSDVGQSQSVFLTNQDRNSKALADFTDSRLMEVDDTGSMSRALKWALNGTTDRTIFLPLTTTISSQVGGAITNTKKLTLVAANGSAKINVADGSDGLVFVRDYGASLIISGRLEIIRRVKAGSTPEAGTAFLLDYKPTDAPSETVNAGTVLIEHLETSASLGGAKQYGWKIGARIISAVNLTIGDFIAYGVNNTGANSENSDDINYNPENFSSGLWLQGYDTRNFMIGAHINRISIRGFSASWRLTGAIQGVTVDMADIIGGAYGLFAPFKQSDLAEEIRISAGSFNSALKNIYISYAGGVFISDGIHLRFSPSVSRPWTAIEFKDCVEYEVINQKGHGSMLKYNRYPIDDSTRETGFYDSSSGVGATGNGTIIGLGIDSLYGPLVRTSSVVQNKVVTAFSAAGVNGSFDIGLPEKNLVMGGMLNGVIYNGPASRTTAYIFKPDLQFNGLPDPSKYCYAEITVVGAIKSPTKGISDCKSWRFIDGSGVVR